MAEHSHQVRIDWDRVFRWSAAFFGIAVALHAADHLRRGMDVVPPAVMVAGMVQLALAAPTVGLVFAGSRWGYLRRHGGGVRQRSGVHRRSSAAELGLLQRQFHQRIAGCAGHVVFVGDRDSRNIRRRALWRGWRHGPSSAAPVQPSRLGATALSTADHSPSSVRRGHGAGVLSMVEIAMQTEYKCGAVGDVVACLRERAEVNPEAAEDRPNDAQAGPHFRCLPSRRCTMLASVLGWVAMIYRMRIYRAVPQNLPIFHEFFRTHLLPVQLCHGARLLGRWETEDGRVVAVWEYDDREAYERVQAAVAADPATRRAQDVRRGLPALFTEKDEVFMRCAPEFDHAAERGVS